MAAAARGGRRRRVLAGLMPGIFLLGYNIGTGSVTAMAKAGAQFGLDLLWAVVLSCLATYVLMEVFGRYTLATGRTALEGFRRDIHPAFALGLLGALAVIIAAALMGVLGIIAEVLSVWSGTILSRPLSPALWALVVTGPLAVLLWRGEQGAFERVLTVLVAIMALAFLATMCLHLPEARSLARGLVPRVPRVAAGSDNGPLVITAGLVGTTVSIFVFLIRTGLVRRQGWGAADRVAQRRDARIGAALMFLISAAVMVTATTTLHARGLRMNTVADMIPLLEPIAGRYALGLFVVGIVAAGLSSHLPNLLVIPWLIQDLRGRERRTRTRGGRCLLMGLCGVSLVGPVLGLRPVFVMLLSQACLAVVLPLGVGGIFYLTCRRDLMGPLVNTVRERLLLTLLLGFALFMGALGLRGVFADLIP